MTFEADAFAHLKVQGGVNRHDQQHMILVAIVNKGGGFQTLGIGPLNVACSKALRHLPFNFWGLTGISSVDPVDVPPRVQVELQAKPELLAGNDRVLFAYECHFADGRGRRLRGGRERLEASESQN